MKEWVNEWIVSKTLPEARMKAMKVKKRFKFYPSILYFQWDNTFNFCISETVKETLNLK